MPDAKIIFFIYNYFMIKKIAVTGAGRWGKNLIREFNKLTKIKYVLHNKSPETKEWLKNNYPQIKIVSSYKDIINDPEIDAVVIATPIKTHFQFAKHALLNGKHIFVEKPITTKYKEAKELKDIAKRKKLTIFTGYVFLSGDIFEEIEKISKKEKILNLYFIWNKFGTFKENVIENLLSHEVSIATALLGEQKIKILKSTGVVTNSDIIRAESKKASFYINRVSDKKEKIVIIKTNKNLYIWEEEELKKLKNDKLEVIFKSKKSSLERECIKFVKKQTNLHVSLNVVKTIEKL